MGGSLGTNQRGGPELNNQPAGINGEEHSPGNRVRPSPTPGKGGGGAATYI